MLSAQLLAWDELHCAIQLVFYLGEQLKEPAVTSSDIAVLTAGTSTWSSESHPNGLLFDGSSEYYSLLNTAYQYLCWSRLGSLA